jgi:hypothetical protein
VPSKVREGNRRGGEKREGEGEKKREETDHHIEQAITCSKMVRFHI